MLFIIGLMAATWYWRSRRHPSALTGLPLWAKRFRPASRLGLVLILLLFSHFVVHHGDGDVGLNLSIISGLTAIAWLVSCFLKSFS